MTIDLYNNTSENNKLDKDITLVSSLSGSLRAGTSLLTPDIMIEGSADSFTPGVNYMHIPDFGRYYYITDVTTERNNVIIIKGRVDVLKTYASQIRNCTGIIRRNAEDWNLYINDGALKTYTPTNTFTRNFPNGFTAGSYVLIMSGS